MWDYVTPNVPVMEMLYTVPSEAGFISKQHTAARSGIFTTLSNEPLANFLTWMKIKRT
jgi:hypothetical protein